MGVTDPCLFELQELPVKEAQAIDAEIRRRQIDIRCNLDTGAVEGGLNVLKDLGGA